MKKNISLVVALVAIVIAVGGYYYPQLKLGATGTRFPNGLSADSTSPAVGEVRGTTLTITGAQTLTGASTLSSTASIAGLLTLNAGQLRSYTNSTSTTATSYTMVVGDVLNYDTVLITPNTGDLTMTFFASSSASTLVPTAGDMQETCFINATTTAGIDITFATGTGIDLERVATSTVAGEAGMLVLPPNGGGCFKFIRGKSLAASFDIWALYTPFIGAE